MGTPPGPITPEEQQGTQVQVPLEPETDISTTGFEALPTSPALASGAFKTTYDSLRAKGVNIFVATIAAAFAEALTGTWSALVSLTAWTVAHLGAPVAGAVIKAIDETRKELSPEAAALAVDVLNELTGASFTADDLPTGKDLQSHIERARIIGGRLVSFLEKEFAPGGSVDPEQGSAAAGTFVGFSVNFAVSTALLGLLGELETLGAIEDFRELGVEVARNIGLGRLIRLALRPLIQHTISTPYEWDLNKRYRPKLLTEAQTIKAFFRGEVSREDMFEELARQGYSDTKVAALIEDSRIPLDIADADVLHRFGLISRADAVTHLVRKGMSPDDAELALTATDTKRADALVRGLIDVYKRQVLNGTLEQADFRALLEPLPLTDDERSFHLVTLGAELELPRRFLTLAQMQTAFQEGVVDLDQLNEYLHREAYSPDDAEILRVLTLIKLGKREEAEKAKEERSKRRAERATSTGKKKAPPPTP